MRRVRRAVERLHGFQRGFSKCGTSKVVSTRMLLKAFVNLPFKLHTSDTSKVMLSV